MSRQTARTAIRGVQGILALAVVCFALGWPGAMAAKTCLLVVTAFSLGTAPKQVDRMFLSLLGLMFIDFIVGTLSGRGELTFSIAAVPFPALMYVVGKLGGKRISGPTTLYYCVLCGAACLSAYVLVSIYGDIIQNGFFGLSRSLEIDGEYTSATVVGGYLVLGLSTFGTTFLPPPKGSIRFAQVFAAALSAFCLFASIRLGNRTELAVFGTSAAIGLYFGYRRSGIYGRSFVLLTAVATMGWLYFNWREVAHYFDYFQDRLDDEASSIYSAGGRVDRWIESFPLLASPTGWGLREIGFSHNFWLDAARSGGWLTFALTGLATYFALIIVRQARRRCQESAFVSDLTVCILLGNACLLFVEPVLDGFLYPFGALCAYLGILSSLNIVGDSRSDDQVASAPHRDRFTPHE